MSLGKSSLYNAILLVVAFTSAVQKTAAQAILCGQYQTWNSTSGQYMIENNAWGADGSGSQCTTVEDEQDGTAFSTTWTWKANGSVASQTQVHSYANVKSKSDTLPVMLSNISEFTVSANWTMYPTGAGTPGTGIPNNFDIVGLNAIGAKADVTLDFFLDPDIKQSTNVSNSKFEVMIWFAAIDATEPIGYADGAVGSHMLDGKNYSLFAGKNSQPGQMVFSFVAPENMTSFSELNVAPLFQYLVHDKKMPSSTYLGTAQFGTEAIHSDGGNVTFEASGIDLTIQPGTAKSNAMSLQGVMGFKSCLGLLEGAIGVWMLWSWML